MHELPHTIADELHILAVILRISTYKATGRIDMYDRDGNRKTVVLDTHDGRGEWLEHKDGCNV